MRSPLRTMPGMMKSQLGVSSTAFTQMRRSLPSRADRLVGRAVVGADEGEVVALEVAGLVLALDVA